MPYTFLVKCKISTEVSISLSKTEVAFFSLQRNRKDLPSYLYLHCFVFFPSLLPSGFVRQDFVFAMTQIVVHQETEN